MTEKIELLSDQLQLLRYNLDIICSYQRNSVALSPNEIKKIGDFQPGK